MSVYPVSDEALVAQFQKGDESGLEELIARYQQRLFTSISILVKDQTLAEDLLQETYLRIIHTLRQGRYQEEGKFLGWAMRIAHNLVIDYYRRDSRMRMVRDTDEYRITEHLKLTDEGVEKQLIQQQTHERLRQLIDLLPFEQREVLIMRHYAELSFKEIAEITQTSINTCLGRMRYALINLRKLASRKKISLTQD
jgi:RNA polymerase sigma-70 factor (ECF subfamily)